MLGQFLNLVSNIYKIWQLSCRKPQELVLNAEQYLLDETVRAMFTDPKLGYDVECCRVVFVVYLYIRAVQQLVCLLCNLTYDMQTFAPYRDEEHFWILYAFDIETCIVHVFDPKRANRPLWALEKKHKKLCHTLIEALSRCVYRFFDGWNINAESFKFMYHNFLEKASNRSYMILHYNIVSYIYLLITLIWFHLADLTVHSTFFIALRITWGLVLHMDVLRYDMFPYFNNCAKLEKYL